MKSIRNGLLLLGYIVLAAGHAGLLQKRADSGSAFASRLAGVRRCLALNAGEEMEVQALKQRFGKESFLVARPAGSPKLVAKTALHATYEALMRGSGCEDSSDETSTAWFLDVGTDDDELLALASSLGCGVTVLDPEVKDVRAVDMTRCMNEEPNRPFVVFQVTAGNVTNPVTLANMTNSVKEEEASGQASALPWVDDEAKDKTHLKALLAMSKPTMLNGGRSRKAADDSEEEKPEAVLPEEPAPTAAPVPMDNTVMLDTVFHAANASSGVQVTGPSGQSFNINKVSVLKVTPRSESAATLKALQGARKLLDSGRVQCLVTEMNFDMNHTEELLKHVGELEQSGFHFAHLGSLDYSELEITNQGQYEVFRTDLKQLQELYDTYKRIRAFDERSGFRVYSGSLSLDRKGHYFDYTDLIFACRGGFPKDFPVMEKGKIRFRNGVWWLEKER